MKKDEDTNLMTSAFTNMFKLHRFVFQHPILFVVGSLVLSAALFVGALGVIKLMFF